MALNQFEKRDLERLQKKSRRSKLTRFEAKKLLSIEAKRQGLGSNAVNRGDVNRFITAQNMGRTGAPRRVIAQEKKKISVAVKSRELARTSNTFSRAAQKRSAQSTRRGQRIQALEAEGFSVNVVVKGKGDKRKEFIEAKKQGSPTILERSVVGLSAKGREAKRRSEQQFGQGIILPGEPTRLKARTLAAAVERESGGFTTEANLARQVDKQVAGLAARRGSRDFEAGVAREMLLSKALGREAEFKKAIASMPRKKPRVILTPRDLRVISPRRRTVAKSGRVVVLDEVNIAVEQRLIQGPRVVGGYDFVPGVSIDIFGKEIPISPVRYKVEKVLQPSAVPLSSVSATRIEQLKLGRDTVVPNINTDFSMISKGITGSVVRTGRGIFIREGITAAATFGVSRILPLIPKLPIFRTLGVKFAATKVGSKVVGFAGSKVGRKVIRFGGAGILGAVVTKDVVKIAKSPQPKQQAFITALDYSAVVLGATAFRKAPSSLTKRRELRAEEITVSSQKRKGVTEVVTETRFFDVKREKLGVRLETAINKITRSGFGSKVTKGLRDPVRSTISIQRAKLTGDTFTIYGPPTGSGRKSVVLAGEKGGILFETITQKGRRFGGTADITGISIAPVQKKIIGKGVPGRFIARVKVIGRELLPGESIISGKLKSFKGSFGASEFVLRGTFSKARGVSVVSKRAFIRRIPIGEVVAKLNIRDPKKFTGLAFDTEIRGGLFKMIKAKDVSQFLGERTSPLVRPESLRFLDELGKGSELIISRKGIVKDVTKSFGIGKAVLKKSPVVPGIPKTESFLSGLGVGKGPFVDIGGGKAVVKGAGKFVFPTRGPAKNIVQELKIINPVAKELSLKKVSGVTKVPKSFGLESAGVKSEGVDVGVSVGVGVSVALRPGPSKRKVVGRVVPKPVVRPVSLPKTLPRGSPKSIPRSLPKVILRSIPRSIPRAIPKVVPKAIPRSIPRSIPRTVPRTIPRTIPRIIPRVIPRTIPRTPRGPGEPFVDIPPFIPLGFFSFESIGRRKRKFPFAFAEPKFVPSVDALVYKVTAPKRRIDELIDVGLTGLETRPVPIAGIKI